MAAVVALLGLLMTLYTAAAIGPSDRGASPLTPLQAIGVMAASVGVLVAAVYACVESWRGDTVHARFLLALSAGSVGLWFLVGSIGE